MLVGHGVRYQRPYLFFAPLRVRLLLCVRAGVAPLLFVFEGRRRAAVCVRCLSAPRSIGRASASPQPALPPPCYPCDRMRGFSNQKRLRVGSLDSWHGRRGTAGHGEPGKGTGHGRQNAREKRTAKTAAKTAERACPSYPLPRPCPAPSPALCPALSRPLSPSPSLSLSL